MAQANVLGLPITGGILTGPLFGTTASFSGTISASNFSGTNTGDQTIILQGEASGSGAGTLNVTLSNSAIIGKVLTGFVAGSGTVTSADTILSAIQKLAGDSSAASAGTLTGSTLASNVLASSLTSVGTLATLTVTATITGSISGNSATVTTNANLTGQVTSVGNSTTLLNTAVTGQVLTGYSSGAGTVAATDSILSAIQKLNGNDGLNLKLAGGTLTGALIGTTATFTTFTGALVGNANTATTLATPRAINGVNFDGSGAITITASAGTLTGSTLASNVLASSLTSVGTLATLTVTATITGSISGNSATVTTNANLTGQVTSVGNSTTLLNTAVTGQVLTGYSSGAGTVAATDSILAAIQKLNGNDSLRLLLTGGSLSGSISASNLSGTNTGDQTITLTGDVTGSGTGSFASSVAKIQSTVVSGTTGSTNVVFSLSPTITTPTILGQTKIQNGTSAYGLFLGGDAGASTLTDATTKQGVLCSPHYTNAQAPVAMLFAQNTSSSNDLYIGGGSSSNTAAKNIFFYTGANNTTSTGTKALTIDGNQLTTAVNLVVGTNNGGSGAFKNVFGYNTTAQVPLLIYNQDTTNGSSVLNVGTGVTEGTTSTADLFACYTNALGKRVFQVSTQGVTTIGSSGTAQILNLNSGTTATGSSIVMITNAPTGVGATPVDYCKIIYNGQTRYIALLG